MEERAKYPKGLEGITFRQFSEHILASKPGQILKGEVRFARFKPPQISNEQWQMILGKDVNNFYHMPLTARMVNFFLYYCQNPPESWPGKLSPESDFSQKEGELLVLAGVFHDTAEAIVTDIPSPIKTDDDRKREMIVLREIMPRILENTDMAALMPHVDEAIDEIISTRTTKLGKAFRAIEEIGFLRVALKAWRGRRQEDPVFKSALIQLAKEVVDRSLPRAEAFALTYPAVFVFLESPRNKKELEEIQEAIKNP